MTKSKWGLGSVAGVEIIVNGIADSKAGVESSSVSNGNNKDKRADLQVTLELNLADPGRNAYLYFLYTGDTKEYGGPSDRPTKAPVAPITLPDGAGPHTFFIDQVPIPPRDFTCLLWNESDRDMSAISVKVWTYLHESS